MTQLAERTNGNGSGGAMVQAGEVARRGLVVDSGQFMNLLDTNRFEHLWRISQLFSSSQMVPAHFQGQPSNCFIAVQMAMRMGVDPFMFMQSSYIVHGKPGLEAKLAIALINSSGLFADPLDYEVEGTDPFDPKYRVRAFATRASTGTTIYGPWVDWKMVKAEGWDGKSGTKWKTMPSVMFQYRAASFFGRLNCPERLMGMQTKEELDDSTPEPSTQPAPPRGADSVLSRLESRGVKKGTEVKPPTIQTEAAAVRASAVETAGEPAAPSSEEETAPAAIEQGDEGQATPDDGNAEAELTLALSQAFVGLEALLLSKARDLQVPRTQFSGGLFKWKQQNPDAVADPKHPARRELFLAIVHKNFDYSKGLIMEPAPA